MEQIRILIGIFIASTFMLGCNRELKEPEKQDPLVAQLGSQMADLQRELDSAIKARDATELSLHTLEPNSIDLKLAKREWSKTMARIDELRQEIQYYDIKIKRRIAEDRFRYRLARKRGEEWAVEEDNKLFEANQRLRKAPRTWDHRVPKLADRIPASKDQLKSEGQNKKESL